MEGPGRTPPGLPGPVRRVSAAIVLAAYLGVALGFPSPAPPRKRSVVSFPCQDHACGCHTAEECSDHCCCFTPSQRRAWAREHHVEPPASTDFREGAVDESAPHECCPGHDDSGCHGEGGACCSAGSRPVAWVLGVQAQRCRGVSTFWITTGAVLPPIPALVRDPALVPSDWLRLPGASACLLAPAPLLRPPRGPDV